MWRFSVPKAKGTRKKSNLCRGMRKRKKIRTRIFSFFLSFFAAVIIVENYANARVYAARFDAVGSRPVRWMKVKMAGMKKMYRIMGRGSGGKGGNG